MSGWATQTRRDEVQILEQPSGKKAERLKSGWHCIYHHIGDLFTLGKAHSELTSRKLRRELLLNVPNELKSKIKAPNSKNKSDLTPAQRRFLENALNPKNQELYRLGVRRAMLEKLVKVTKNCNTVVSETLDVVRLHQAHWKHQMIARVVHIMMFRLYQAAKSKLCLL